MNTIEYLKEIYGYATPIFLKDIRIGRKSKVAIRKELSRAVEKGEICRRSQGVYWFKDDSALPLELSFEDIIRKKYICDNYGFQGLDLDVYGYYTGVTFLHYIGLTQQVPAVIEIVTNNTSCMRYYFSSGYKALLYKPKTKIDRFNYKALQFFDAIKSLSVEEIRKNKALLCSYITKNLHKSDFENYIGLYPIKVMKVVVAEGLIDAFRLW